MRNSFNKFRVLFALLIAMPLAAIAQPSSVNTFSPYTFYGIGDMHSQGPTFLRSMGGIGVAYSYPGRINYTNPASYGDVSPRSMIFDIGMEGQNIYSKSLGKKTSHNSFNFRDLAIKFPLARRIGLGVSVTPLTSAGYRVEMAETNQDIIGEIGSVAYMYVGTGGITQAKISLGGRITKRLSLGADMLYYHGRINRSFSTAVISLNPNDVVYNSAKGSYLYDYEKLSFNLGVQYNIIMNKKHTLTFGAVYSPKVNMNPGVSRIINVTGGFNGNVNSSYSHQSYYLPSNIKAGLYLDAGKWGTGLDVGYQNWAGLNAGPQANISYRDVLTINAGAQFTPNATDVRKVLNRWTYRFGGRYEDYYMNINGQKISDMAITAGVGIPLRMGRVSNLNVGLEFGQRGSTASGLFGTQKYNMIKEGYWKVALGLTLFAGDDYDSWFQKYKFD